MKKSEKISVLVLAILVLVGCLGWVFLHHSTTPEASLPTVSSLTSVVDRGLDEEHTQMFRDKIFESEATVAANEANGTRDIGAILVLGNLYYELGELESAATWYRDILRTNPEDAPALENLAQTQIEMGDWSGAEKSLRAAANVSAYEPTYMKLVDLIDAHFPERSGEIQTILETAIANLGQTSGLLSRLGQWYADQGMLDEAISHYQVAHQIDPEDQSISDEITRLKQERKASQPQTEKRIIR